MILSNRQTVLYSPTSVKATSETAPSTTEPRIQRWTATSERTAPSRELEPAPAPVPRAPVCESLGGRYACSAYGQDGALQRETEVPVPSGSPFPIPRDQQIAAELARIDQVIASAPRPPVDLDRALALEESADGTIVSTDAFSQGAVQGLQRAILDFASKNGIPLTLTVDGNLSGETIEAVVAISERLGLPDGMQSLTIESLASNVKRIAEHVAVAAGTITNYTPSEPAVLSASSSEGSTTPVAKPASKFRKFTIGAGVILGILAITR